MSDAVAVRLPHELAERLDEVAQVEQRSRANAARWLLAEALTRRESKEAVDE